MTDVQPAEGIDRAPGAVGADDPGRLREDVVRVVVAQDGQRSVALGVPGAEAHGRRTHAVHADSLSGDSDKGISSLEDLQTVAAVEVVAGRDVVPGRDDGAIERGGVSRSDTTIRVLYGLAATAATRQRPSRPARSRPTGT